MSVFLQFRLDGDRFGLPVADVLLITRAVAVRRLPAAPRVVDGIINLKGRLVPVLNLRTRFGYAPRRLDPNEHFLVVRGGERVVVFRVDEALGILQVDTGGMERLDGIVTDAKHVAGAAKTAEGIVLIHDVTAFLTEAESAALDQALAATTPA